MRNRTFAALAVVGLCLAVCVGSAPAAEPTLLDYDGTMVEPVGETPTGTAYMLTDHFGGTWWDCEKSSDNTEDDLLCWAAQTSNLLAWTGWGSQGGMTDAQVMFQYYQDHWTDVGGNSYYGLDWWFDGTNDSQGLSGWSQVDVAGGGFCPGENINDYRHWSSNDSAALSTIDSYQHSGYATGLSLSGGGAHAITCWGFNYDENDADYYVGIWVTDSDDDKGGVAPRPDTLRYYEVAYSGGAWYLQDYYGSDAWYISEVIGMATPEPGTLALVAMGGLALTLRRRRRR